MLFCLEYFFLIVFFLYTSYDLLDKNFILSSLGTKLKKYINNNLQSMTCNFEEQKNKNSFINLFKKIIKSSKTEYKYYLLLILVSMSLTSIKLALTYKFLVSNFYYIQIFNKQILISTILSNKYIYFKIFYYLLSFYFIFFLILKISKYFKMLKNKNNAGTNVKEEFILLGKDELNRQVFINKSGAFQNVLITGSIGSGKTSSAITNILDCLIRNNIFGLIIDVKGNYINTVKKVIKKYHCENKLIEISLLSNAKYNPLGQDISAVEMASVLKKVLTLISPNNNSDPFWLDKVEEYVKDFIIIAKAVDGYVTFYEIHNMVIDKEYLDEKIARLKSKILENKYTDEELFNINSSLQTIINEYYKLDDRTINIIRSEITRITSVFVSDYKIYEKFCTSRENINFLSDKIVVLSIDFGSNKKIAKILSTYLKLDFQRQVLSNYSSKEVFFICDEYQEFANEEDSHFFSISREYKCINIVSMQSYSSLINTLKNEKASNVIIQNLVNKIYFRNDDTYTIQEVIKLFGKQIKKSKSVSVGEGGGRARYSMFSNKFKSFKTSLSQNYTITERQEYMIDESYLTQKLNTFESLCLISDGNSIDVYKKVKINRWEEEDYEE